MKAMKTLEQILADHCTGMDDHDEPTCHKCNRMFVELTDLINQKVSEENEACKLIVLEKGKGLYGREGLLMSLLSVEIARRRQK